MVHRYKWCGDAIFSDKHTMCDACRLLSKNYNRQVKEVLSTSGLGEQLRFRNNCMDIINFRQRGGVDTPGDVDYQLERVKRYLGEA